MALTYKDFYEITGATQHSEFETYLKEVLFKPKERKEFYDKLLEVNCKLSEDTFKPYFELYAAERKSNQQDYTPDSVAKLLAVLTRSDPVTLETSKYAGYDATAGTGSLLIQKWNDDRIQESPWSYAPHRYTYRADEMADNAIPYLIHNFALRGMNAIIVHRDVLTGKSKQVYFIQNSNDDFMAYSDINVMPHTKDCMEEFDITEWIQEEIKHVESQDVYWQYALPMKRKALEVNADPKPKARNSPENHLKLKHVAEIERAKKEKVYPKGSIVVQISASKGQVGLLTSHGEIDNRYAVISTESFINSEFAFYFIKKELPRHLHRVQEGLNIPIEEIGNCPFSFPMELLQLIIKEPEYEQLALDL